MAFGNGWSIVGLRYTGRTGDATRLRTVIDGGEVGEFRFDEGRRRVVRDSDVEDAYAIIVHKPSVGYRTIYGADDVGDIEHLIDDNDAY